MHAYDIEGYTMKIIWLLPHLSTIQPQKVNLKTGEEFKLFVKNQRYMSSVLTAKSSKGRPAFPMLPGQERAVFTVKEMISSR